MISFDRDQLIITRILPEYYEANLDLLNVTIRESHFLARRNEISLEESNYFMKNVLNYPNTIYLIALYLDKVIGHISAIPRFEDLLEHVLNIGYLVHRDFRGKQVGTRLMEQLIIEAKTQGRVKILVAEVAEDNLVSISLLKKFKFTEFGRLPCGMMKKDESFVDLLYYSKHL